MPSQVARRPPTTKATNAAWSTSNASASTPTTALQRDDRLEAAVGHSLALEGHRRLHQLRHARVLHDLRVHAVAVLARLVDDEGEGHGLALLQFRHFREERAELRVQVVAYRLGVRDGAGVHPDLAGAARDRAI